MRCRRRPSRLVVVSAVRLPLFASDYLLEIATLVLIEFIAVIGLGFLTGFAGRISLAQGALVGVGAYTAALLLRDVGLPPLVGLPVADRRGERDRHCAWHAGDPPVRPLFRHVHHRHCSRSSGS